jgi:hypothetical protein
VATKNLKAKNKAIVLALALVFLSSFAHAQIISVDNISLDVDHNLVASVYIDTNKRELTVAFSHSLLDHNNPEELIEDMLSKTRILVNGKPLDLQKIINTESSAIFKLPAFSSKQFDVADYQVTLGNAPITEKLPFNRAAMERLKVDLKPVLTPGELRILGEKGVDAFEKQSLAVKPLSGDSTSRGKVYRTNTDLHTHFACRTAAMAASRRSNLDVSSWSPFRRASRDSKKSWSLWVAGPEKFSNPAVCPSSSARAQPW